MKIKENELESIIMNTHRDKLRKHGLWLTGFRKNQLRIGNYGIADIVTYTKPDFEYKNYDLPENQHPHITVYELKVGRIGFDAYDQALRYLRGIQLYMEAHRKYDVTYSIRLIGSEIDLDSSFSFLPNLCHWRFGVEMYTYQFDIDGLKFNEIRDYKLIDPGFQDE